MFCKYCGNNLPDGVKFCPACGKPTANADAAPKKSSIPNTGASRPVKPVHPMGTSAAPKAKIRKTYNIGNFILWGGCAVALISLFLPYCSASISLLGYSASESLTLMEADDGIFFLVIIAIVAVLNIFKLNILCIAGSAFHMFLVTYENQNINDYVGGLVEYNMGHTLLLLGSIAMLISSIVALVLWIRQKNIGR